MKNLKIGVDIDGVVGNFIKLFSMHLRDMYGKELPIVENSDNVPDWDMHLWYPLSKQQISDGFKEINKSNSFWMQLELINKEHWENFIHSFNHPFYDVYFITSRENGINIHYQTVSWLYYHGWENPQVILSNKKYNIINGIGIDYFIDDNFLTVKDATEKTNATCVLYNYPHNNIINQPDLLRVNNLEEFTNLILQNEK